MAENFSANVLFLRSLSGQYPLRRRKDGNAETADHAWNRISTNVDPAAGFTDSLHALYDGHLLVNIFQVNADQALLAVLYQLYALHISFVLQDLCQFQFKP